VTSQLLPLLQNELIKAGRRKLPAFGVLAVGLVCVVAYFMGGRLSGAATANAWGYVAFSMQLVFTDIGPIFVIVFSAMLLAEETGTGTIRSALAAPVHRWELYLAKAAAGILYMLVLSAAALLFSIALGSIHYDFAPIADSFGTVYSRSQSLQQFALGLGLSWIPLSSLVMYALFISVLVRTPGAAVAAGISILFIVDLTKHLVGLDPYVFTKYIEFSWTLLQQLAQGMDYQWRPEVWNLIFLSSVSGLVAFIAGLTLFIRTDLNH
jgi:ABC-type transport system involved in multi-copper enzyme maturation permease subunit